MTPMRASGAGNSRYTRFARYFQVARILQLHRGASMRVASATIRALACIAMFVFLQPRGIQ
jgi:hypothetical protein